MVQDTDFQLYDFANHGGIDLFMGTDSPEMWFNTKYQSTEHGQAVQFLSAKPLY